MSIKYNLNEDEQLLILKYNQAKNRVYCPNCGLEVLYYDKYCYNCGNKLELIVPVGTEKDTPGIQLTKANEELYLKYASVVLLQEYIQNPFFSIKNSKNILSPFKSINLYDIRNYLITGEYIELLEGIEKFKASLNLVPDQFLLQILEQKQLSAKDSREENIQLLLKNLSEDELNRMFGYYYKVTEKGLAFSKENVHCIYYARLFYDYDLKYFDDRFNNSNKEITEFGLNLISDSFEDTVNNLKWQSYSELLFKYAEIYDIRGDYDKMMFYFLQHFICEVNPFSDNKIKSKIEISIYLKNKVAYTLSKFHKDLDTLIEEVKVAINEIKIPHNYVPLDELVYLLEELFDSTTKIREVNNHLIDIYKGNEIIRLEKMSFENEKEQEEVLKNLNEYFI